MKIKKIFKYILMAFLILVAIIVIVSFLVLTFNSAFGAKPNGEYLEKIKATDNYSSAGFKNAVSFSLSSSGDEGFISSMKAFFFENRKARTPVSVLPNKKIDKDRYQQSSGETLVTWLGHSTILIKTGGQTIITDPVFSPRASFFDFLGPKKFKTELDYSVDDLPNIDVVLISHDHYDHLDYKAILKLKDKVKKFYVPLGVKSHLLSWGVEAEKIIDINWYDEENYNNIKFILTPAKHFSGRGISDRMKTLWGGWIIESGEEKLFFSGDSGYYEEFKKIGQQYGPFDIAFVECGAYDKLWIDVHMLPEETVQASIDLQAKQLLPIHNSKFDLAIHSWRDPLDRVLASSEEKGVDLLTPLIGESFVLGTENFRKRWWLDLK